MNADKTWKMQLSLLFLIRVHLRSSAANLLALFIGIR